MGGPRHIGPRPFPRERRTTGLTTEAVEQCLRKAGIPRWGVCAFADLPPLLPCRAAARLPEGARSVVVCLFPYYVGEYPDRNLSRYAIVDDYHTVTRAMLEDAAARLCGAFPGHRFEPFVDSSPVREVAAGWRAGLGFIGRNGQLIAPEYGSYCFLGEIVTTLELPPAVPSRQTCGGCRRCVEACPGGALSGDGGLELSRCRSHITQKKGELTEWEQRAIAEGGFAWGCDRCTDVCPHNQNPRCTPIKGFYRDIVHKLTLENCRALSKTRAYGWRGAAVLERNLRLCQGEAPVGKE